MKVEIGQEVLIYTVGNNARHGISWYKGIVTKVGRKWFYVNTNNYIGEREKFSLDNGKCDGGDYISGWQAFLSEEQYNEQEGLQTLRNEVVSLLRTLTYKQLLEIKNTYENKAIKEN